MKKRGNKKENKGFLKSRKSQQVLGMSFGVIFSILLIIFFIIIAFIAINAFLKTRDCAKIGLFIDDLEVETEKAWNLPKSDFNFKSQLPDKIKYVCFADFSKGMSGNYLEIGREIAVYKNSGANMFFHPREKSCNMPYVKVPHLNLPKITIIDNPYCIKNINGILELRIERKYNDKYVTIKKSVLEDVEDENLDEGYAGTVLKENNQNYYPQEESGDNETNEEENNPLIEGIVAQEYLCKINQAEDTCEGLNLIEEGYKTACCNQHNVCC